MDKADKTQAGEYSQGSDILLPESNSKELLDHRSAVADNTILATLVCNFPIADLIKVFLILTLRQVDCSSLYTGVVAKGCKCGR